MSLVLLVAAMTALSVFTITLEDNITLRTLLTDFFSNDPKAQRENVDAAVIENITGDTIVFLKGILIFPIGYLGLLTIANGTALFLTKRYPYGSAVTFIVVGALSFFTVMTPLLLVPAGMMMLKRMPNRNVNQ
ncbi:hypothetical protein [Lentibacillus salinarum]|uniref:DUF4064 domain-containing protein n=1 Tax=Lentibacillus salinarum TaxID=446820 RepID=A0ABW3ZTV3_9BACI